MNLDPKVCHRALLARDARFDGRFFVAVRTTGVYCRPVCPAPTPKLENCRFVACAAAAQEAGFRPCLRCRPEASPGTPAWLGSCASVSRALRLIGEGALREGNVGGLAERLGIGERQLRRLFIKHLGASPVAVEQTRRILFAKKLVDETTLPMTEVAFASGFASVRRFNDAIRKTYDRSPSELRGAAPRKVRSRESSELELRLPFRKPFDWKAMTGYLAGRATPGVEQVSGDVYRRSVRIGNAQGEGEAKGTVCVRRVPGESWLVASIRMSSGADLIGVAGRLRRIFDLDADPAEIGRHLKTDPRLREAVRAWPGARVPGTWDGFELAVRAILGQQVSVKGATTIAGRLAAAYGEPLDDAADGIDRLFPTPARLRDVDLTGIGLTNARARTVTGLAAAVDDGKVELDSPRGLDETIRDLCELPGIGVWTAQYIAMRALREPDAFPIGDLGLRRALGNGAGPVSDRELAQAAEAWRPWRAYAAMHLWMSESRQAAEK